MTRIGPDALVTLLEVTLTSYSFDTLAAFHDTVSKRRRLATFTFTQYLADRLGCFEIIGCGLGGDAVQQVLPISGSASRG